MTHEELLAKIDALEARYTDYLTYLALRAVVELHKSDDHFCVECSHDVDYLFKYPCKTIQAIEEHLK